MVIRPYIVTRISKEEAIRRYGDKACFCNLGNQPSVIIGLDHDARNERIELKEKHRIPAWKMTINPNMHRGGFLTEFRNTPVAFQNINRDSIKNGTYFYAYEKEN